MKFLKILLAFVFLTFLISSISAMTIYGGWQGDVQSITITNGQSVQFSSDFISMNPPASLRIQLYKNGNSIYSFGSSDGFNQNLNSYTDNYSGTISPSIYGSTTGTYELLISGTDQVNTNSWPPLTLIVNPVPLITDTTPPAILYNPTTEANNSYLTRNYALVNISASDLHLSYVILDWNGINTTLSDPAGNNYWINETNLVNGNYTFYAWANDTYGNSNQTATYTISINTTSPVIPNTTYPLIHLISPINNLYSNNQTQIFSANATDNATLSNLTLYVWNSAGLVYSNTVSLTGTSNSTSWIFNFNSDGNYTWNVLGIDTAGNANWSKEGNYTLLIDTVAPQIQFVDPTPSNNSVLNSTTISVNLTVLDILSRIKSINVSLYNSTGIVDTASGSLYQFSNLQPEVYYLNATAVDNLGNMNSTQTITITLQSSSNQTNNSSPTNFVPIANPYTYSDVYGAQYNQQQENNNAAPVTELTPQTKQSSNGYIPLLIAETILILCALVITIIIASRKLKK